MKVDKYNVIGDLIESNKKQFIIPVYQRNYEWFKPQCKKLYDDIINAFEHKKKHFVGSIVYVELGEIEKLHTYVIIDGQQRITTLYLLLKALYDLCGDKDNYAKEEISDILFNKDKYNELKLTSQTKLKLKPIKSDNNQLLLLMNNDVSEMNPTSHIYINYMYFKDLISDTLISKDIRIKDIVEGMKNLVSAVIALNDGDDDPQVVFESINSTGLDLSLADLIRNYVLMTDKQQEYLFENYWLKIEQNVGIESMTNYITFYLTFRSKEVVSNKNAYEVYKRYYASAGYNNEEALKDLYHYSNYYKAFCNGDSKYSSIVNKRLEGLRILDQSTAYPFLFSIFNDYDNNVITMEELEKVITFLFIYLLRRIICGVPSNSLRGLFKNLYSRIFADENNKKHYYDAVVQFFIQLSTKDKVPSDTEFKNSLMTSDLYQKKKTCKYLLKTLEDINEDGTESKELISIDKLTIEHIMPQTLNDDWIEALGENYAQIHSQYVHTLGNLTLTGYNSELLNKSFTDKKKLLNDKNSHIVVLNRYFMDQEKWDEDTIKERARLLSDRIQSIFKIDLPIEKIKFNNDENTKITLLSDYDATGTKPTSFIFLGESENVTFYREMLLSIMTKLYEMDSSIMIKMAEQNYKIPNATKTYITLDKTLLRSPMEISDSNIYIEGNLSANTILSMIKNVFDKYSIDDNDFVLFVKNDESDDSDDSDDEMDLRTISRKLMAKEITRLLNQYSNEYNIEVVSSGTKYVRFISKEIRKIVGQDGCGWIKTNDLFAFEFNNSFDHNIELNLYMGPSKHNEERKKWYDYFMNYGEKVKPSSKMNNKWDRFYHEIIISNAKAFDDEKENVKAIDYKIKEFLTKFMPEIILEFKKVEVE